MKRTFGFAASALVAVASVQPVLAAQIGVPGYMTPQGTFRPMPLAVAKPAAGGTLTYGRVAVAISVQLVNKQITSTNPLRCAVQIQLFNAQGTSADQMFATDSVEARVDGNTATCKPAVNYSLNLDTPQDDKIQITYVLEGQDFTGGGVGPYTSVLYDTIAVPPNGYNVSLSVSAKL